MLDVTALGELLIDFTPSGLSESGNPRFEQNPGGGPGNVLTALTKLGGTGAFIGVVGNDQFGRFLYQVLQNKGIDVRGLKFSNIVNTTLAFVHLDPSGDRSFSFYRNPGADLMLSADDLDYNLIKQSKIFHFGAVSMTGEPSRSATLKAAKFAKDNGLMVSYDPNYRPPLWENERVAKEIIQSGLRFADIIKVSEGELELLTGTSDLVKGSAILFDQGIQIVLATLGPDGCFYRYQGGTGHLPTFDIQVIDTTGAGDAFLGAILYHFSKKILSEICDLSILDFERILEFANATGALATTKKGGIPAMPSLEEVLHCMKEIPKR